MPKDEWRNDRERKKVREHRREQDQHHYRDIREGQEEQAAEMAGFVEKNSEFVRAYLATIQNNGTLQDRLDGRKNLSVPSDALVGARKNHIVGFLAHKLHQALGLQVAYRAGVSLFEAGSVIESCEQRGISLLPSLAAYKIEQKTKNPDGLTQDDPLER